MVTKELQDQIVDALLPEMKDSSNRRALIESALHGSPVLLLIKEWEDAALPFTRRLVRQLDEFGLLKSGQLALTALLQEVRSQVGTDRQASIDRLLSQLITTSHQQAAQLQSALTEYHHARIEEWKRKLYALDKRFVNLTLTLDRRDDEQQPVESSRFNDLRDVLKRTIEQRACVLLGAPGSGKSTLLRRLQFDHSTDQLRDRGEQISFFIQLNGYRARPDGTLPAPREWLNERWSRLNPHLSPLESWLQEGHALLLLDALNEMPHKDTVNYFDLIEYWRDFAREAIGSGNQVVFTCRRQDYSSALNLPIVEVQPLEPVQIQAFLRAYLPAQAERVWSELKDSASLLDLYQRPYFLRLLCEQIDLTGGEIPRGRASLFTGFVRKALSEEVKKNSELLHPNLLLTEKDHLLISGGQKYPNAFALPERGALIPALSRLAYNMQKMGAQVRLNEDSVAELLAHESAEAILKVGQALNVLDEDSAGIAFFHQLLQEYFAARQMTREFDPALVHVEWEADKVHPRLADVLSALDDYEPLPPLPQTGWEEIVLTAVPMITGVARTEQFIRELIPHNLPLAASCAAASEVSVSNELKDKLRDLLKQRSQDFQRADLRARIAAGEALGRLGDLRFERRSGKHGDYLLPPLTGEIVSGNYPMGVDQGKWDDEEPAHRVSLTTFQIGQFPVTNGEYAKFIEAGGYENEEWWDTTEALAWLRNLNGHQPEYWNDTGFDNPAQPVVRVTWYEARAYCHWLTATAADGKVYRLPTEAEYEAAARGQQGRLYPYGDTFDASRCNTAEGHVRRTTPVGIYDNATPEGAYDLSGNVWTWTLSIYDQNKYPYPYRGEDGREDISVTGANRVLRGGSWDYSQMYARAVYRNFIHPAGRFNINGFRVVVRRPPSV